MEARVLVTLMSYYKILKLEREPFSTSPDPSFFYRSNAHNVALNKLEIAIRLRRGLSVILGDVGTGKTTLSRALVGNFRNDDNFIFHLILAPSYKKENEFLSHLLRLLGIKKRCKTIMDYKDALERYLYQKGVIEKKTIVLLIDEAQVLPLSLLEVLRVLLNYETNEYKLLQLVIMAQMEFLVKIIGTKNFMDRITFKYILPPLSLEETENMINYRLLQAGYTGYEKLFTRDAIKEIHSQTLGYPRKVTNLCHSIIEYIVMMGKTNVDEKIVEEVTKREVDGFRFGEASVIAQQTPKRVVKNENSSYSGYSLRGAV